MSFYATNDRFQVTNAKEEVVFDTMHKMPAITQTIVGNVALKNGSQLLGYIDPTSNFIYPVIRYTNGNYAGTYEICLNTRMYSIGWFTAAGKNISFINTLSFIISGTAIYLVCEEGITGFTNTDFQGARIDYRILVGSTI